MLIFFSKFFGGIISSFFYRGEFFYSDKEDGVFFVWRNVSVVEVLGAARYCAKGTKAQYMQRP